MIIITFRQGHGFHFEAFNDKAEAQAFAFELFNKGVDFEIKFK